MTRVSSPSPLSFRKAAVVAVSGVLLVACSKSDTPGAAAPTSASSTPTSSTEATLMQKGVDLLYRSNNPFAAADTFRAVLAANPQHYGARFQLAKALDFSGKPEEARPIWVEVLSAAEAAKDTVSAHTARVRLASPDTVSQLGMMNMGLDQMYVKKNPAAAAEQFRKILARNPNHYGAHFQLAKALDAAGKPNEALPYWQKILTMAQNIKDQPTIDAANARLQKK